MLQNVDVIDPVTRENPADSFCVKNAILTRLSFEGRGPVEFLSKYFPYVRLSFFVVHVFAQDIVEFK